MLAHVGILLNCKSGLKAGIQSEYARLHPGINATLPCLAVWKAWSWLIIDQCSVQLPVAPGWSHGNHGEVGKENLETSLTTPTMGPWSWLREH